MKTFAVRVCSLLLLSVAWTQGAEPKPLMTILGKQLLNEDFTGTGIPAAWQPGGRSGSFSVIDGAVRGICPRDDTHGPSLGVPIAGRNLTIQFAMKYTYPGNFLFLVDGESQFGKRAAHLFRVALQPKQIVVQQDRGSMESKEAQAAERASAGGKPITTSAEQLADPKFYRTERLAESPRNLVDGKWHTVLVELNGTEAVVQVDEGAPLLVTCAVLDVPKSRMVFLVGGAATALIDNVRVWENSQRSDWAEKRAALSQPPK